MGQFEFAAMEWERALAVARDQGDVPGEVDVRNRLAHLAVLRGELGEAQTQVDAALILVHQAGSEAGIARTRQTQGIVHWSVGQYRESLAALEEALALRRRADAAAPADPLALVEIFNALSVVHVSLGNYREALGYLDQCLELERQVGDKGLLAKGLANQGVVYEKLGELDQALAQGREAYRLYHEIGDREGMSMTLGNLGIVYLEMDEPTAAMGQLQRAADLSREVGNVGVQVDATIHLGAAEAALGHLPEGRERIEAGIALAEMNRLKDKVVQGRYHLGRLAQQGGDATAAREHFSACLTQAQTLGLREYQEKASDRLAELPVGGPATAH